MNDFARKALVALSIGGIGVLAMLLIGCTPIGGPTILGPGGLYVVELGPGLRLPETKRAIPQSSDYRYHLMRDGQTLTWGGLLSFKPLRPFTWAEFEAFCPEWRRYDR